MKHRNSEEHRIEQRLRRIETQLQDILMALDHQSSERPLLPQWPGSWSMQNHI